MSAQGEGISSRLERRRSFFSLNTLLLSSRLYLRPLLQRHLRHLEPHYCPPKYHPASGHHRSAYCPTTASIPSDCIPTMTNIILSANAGSSSVKVSVYLSDGNPDQLKQLAEVSVSGLTAPPAKLSYERGDVKIKDKELDGAKSQEEAFKYIIEHVLNDHGLPELQHRDDVEFVCHRVVHGGDYPRAQVIDDNIYHHIEKLSDLAPL